MSKIYCHSCGFLQPDDVTASGPEPVCSECRVKLRLPGGTPSPPPEPQAFVPADEALPLVEVAADVAGTSAIPFADPVAAQPAPSPLPLPVATVVRARATPVAGPVKSRGPSPVAVVAGVGGLVVVGLAGLVAGVIALRPGGPAVAATAPTAANVATAWVPAVTPPTREERLTELRAGDEAGKLRGLRQLALDAPAGGDELLAQAAAELSHESATVRAAALAALEANDGPRPPDEARLRVALLGTRPDALLYAAKGYGRTPAAADAVERLGKLCDDESAAAGELRRAAVAALANCAPAARPQAFGHLAYRLDDPDAGVRAATLAALRRGRLAPAERTLLADRLHAAGTLRRFKSVEGRVSVANLLKDDSADPDAVLAALRPSLAASEAPEVRACALDAVLASDAATRQCAGGGGAGPTLLELLVTDPPSAHDPSPAARRRVVAALAALTPPPTGFTTRLVAALERDPDDRVRIAAAKLLCASPLAPPGGVGLARKLLASPGLDPADKVKVLDALAALPSDDRARAVLPSAWPELWGLVEGATRQPLAAEVTLRALDLLDGLTDTRPDAADAAKTARFVETLVQVGFGPSGPDSPRYGDQVHAAATRLLRHFPGPAVEALAGRAGKADSAPVAGRIYAALADLGATGPRREVVVGVLDTLALPRAKLDAAFRPAAGAAAAKVGGDKLADRLFPWTERVNPATKENLPAELRVWALATLGAMDPASLTKEGRAKLVAQFQFLESYGKTPAIVAAASAAGEAFKAKAKK